MLASYLPCFPSIPCIHNGISNRPTPLSRLPPSPDQTTTTITANDPWILHQDQLPSSPPASKPRQQPPCPPSFQPSHPLGQSKQASCLATHASPTPISHSQARLESKQPSKSTRNHAQQKPSLIKQTDRRGKQNPICHPQLRLAGPNPADQLPL